MSVMSDIELARFVDRWTMEHVRIYPHPVDRVGRAITDAEHIARWFGEAAIDLRLGGEARFGPAHRPWFTTVVTALDPPRVIEFSDPLPENNAGFFRYELFAVEGACRMMFTQHFAPQDRFEPVPGDLGGDLPAGPDTPWKPGFVGGWHDFFDRLAVPSMVTRSPTGPTASSPSWQTRRSTDWSPTATCRPSSRPR